jgi:hypothetical protein
VIVNIVGPEPESEAFGMACRRAHRFAGNQADVNLVTAEREPDGWLEYLLSFQKEGKQWYLIAMIQRTPGAEWEFHS